MNQLNRIYQQVRLYQPRTAQMINSSDRQAAVLIPIIKIETPELLFTLRSDNLPTHAGQISFPGGMRDKTDKSLIQTALRESEEEIDLKRENVEIIGSLCPITSHLGVQVSPYIGFIDDALNLKKNPNEVAEIFSVPLNDFLNTTPKKKHRTTPQGVIITTPSFQYNHYEIWGLTAMMIVELVEMISKP